MQCGETEAGSEHETRLQLRLIFTLTAKRPPREEPRLGSHASGSEHTGLWQEAIVFERARHGCLHRHTNCWTFVRSPRRSVSVSLPRPTSSHRSRFPPEQTSRSTLGFPSSLTPHTCPLIESDWGFWKLSLLSLLSLCCLSHPRAGAHDTHWCAVFRSSLSVLHFPARAKCDLAEDDKAPALPRFKEKSQVLTSQLAFISI